MDIEKRKIGPIKIEVVHLDVPQPVQGELSDLPENNESSFKPELAKSFESKKGPFGAELDKLPEGEESSFRTKIKGLEVLEGISFPDAKDSVEQMQAEQEVQQEKPQEELSNNQEFRSVGAAAKNRSDLPHEGKEAARFIVKKLKRDVDNIFAKIKKEIEDMPEGEKKEVNLDELHSKLEEIKKEGLAPSDENEIERYIGIKQRVELPKIVTNVKKETQQKKPKKTLEKIDKRGEYTLEERKGYVDRTIAVRIAKVNDFLKKGKKSEIKTIGALPDDYFIISNLDPEEQKKFKEHIIKKNKELELAKGPYLAEERIKAKSVNKEKPKVKINSEAKVSEITAENEPVFEKINQEDVNDIFHLIYDKDNSTFKALNKEEQKLAHYAKSYGYVDKLKELFLKFIETTEGSSAANSDLQQAVREFCSNEDNIKKINSGIKDSEKKKNTLGIIMKMAKSSAETVVKEEVVQDEKETKTKEVIAEKEEVTNETNKEAETENAQEIGVSSEEEAEVALGEVVVNSEPEKLTQATEVSEISIEKDNEQAVPEAESDKESIEKEHRTLDELYSAYESLGKAIEVLSDKNPELTEKIEKERESVSLSIASLEEILKNVEKEKAVKSFQETDTPEKSVEEGEISEKQDPFENWSLFDLKKAYTDLSNSVDLLNPDSDLVKNLKRNIQEIGSRIESRKQEELDLEIVDDVIENEVAVEDESKKQESIEEKYPVKKEKISADNRPEIEKVLKEDPREKELRVKKNEERMQEALAKLEQARLEYAKMELEKRKAYGAISKFIGNKSTNDNNLKNDHDLGYFRDTYNKRIRETVDARLDDLDEKNLNQREKDENIRVLLLNEDLDLPNIKVDESAKESNIVIPESLGKKAYKKARSIMEKLGIAGLLVLSLAGEANIELKVEKDVSEKSNQSLKVDLNESEQKKSVILENINFSEKIDFESVKVPDWTTFENFVEKYYTDKKDILSNSGNQLSEEEISEKAKLAVSKFLEDGDSVLPDDLLGPGDIVTFDEKLNIKKIESTRDLKSVFKTESVKINQIIFNKDLKLYGMMKHLEVSENKEVIITAIRKSQKNQDDNSNVELAISKFNEYLEAVPPNENEKIKKWLARVAMEEVSKKSSPK